MEQGIGELAKAMPKMMGEMKNASNTKQGFGYKYAPLGEILDAVRPILTKHGFSVVQTVGTEGGMIAVRTMLLHESGQKIESEMMLPPADVKGTNDIQQMGASITYARRYMITALLGIAGEEDTDGRPEGHRGDRKAQPKRVDDLSDRLTKAEQMVKAIIANAKTSIPNKDAMEQALDAVRGMDDNEAKYQEYRSLYSSITKSLTAEASGEQD